MICFVSLFVFLGDGYAQNSHPSVNDTLLKSIPVVKLTGENVALVMLNDKFIPNGSGIAEKDMADLFDMETLTPSVSVKRFGKKGENGVLVITTKGYAIKQYQNKLSAFSREYESYLKSHNGKDDDIQYVVHSDPLEKQEVLNFLYKLPPEKIIGVTFTERRGLNGNGSQKVVIIETKVGE